MEQRQQFSKFISCPLHNFLSESFDIVTFRDLCISIDCQVGYHLSPSKVSGLIHSNLSYSVKNRRKSALFRSQGTAFYKIKRSLPTLVYMYIGNWIEKSRQSLSYKNLFAFMTLCAFGTENSAVRGSFFISTAVMKL